MGICFSATLLDRELLTDLLVPADIEKSMSGRRGDDAIVFTPPKQILESTVCKMINPEQLGSFDWDLIRDQVAPLIGVPFVRIEANYGENGTRTILTTERLIPMKEMISKIIKLGGDDEYKYETILELFRMKIHASSLLLQETGLICDSDPSNFGYDPISQSLRLYDYGHLIPLGTPDTIELTEENLKQTKLKLKDLGAIGRYAFYKMTDLANIENLVCSQKLKLMLIEGITSVYKNYESQLEYFFQFSSDELISIKANDPSYYDDLLIGPLADYRYPERLKYLKTRTELYRQDICDGILLRVYQKEL
jgi:hypothetical protein